MIDLDYKNYLLSAKWRLKREELFAVRSKICERCKSVNNIQVHHKTYKNIFNEPLDDLEVLCKPCHMSHHKIENEKRLDKNTKQKSKKKKRKSYTPPPKGTVLRKYQRAKPPKKIIELLNKGFSIQSIAKLKSLYIYDVLDMKRYWVKHLGGKE